MPRLHGRAVGDAIQPAPHRLGPADRRDLACQDDEHRPKRVLGILAAMQHAPSHAPARPAMPLDEPAEGILFPPGDEPFQELPVAGAALALSWRGRFQQVVVGGWHYRTPAILSPLQMNSALEGA